MQYTRDELVTLYQTWLAANPRISLTRLSRAVTGEASPRLVAKLLRGDNLTTDHCQLLSVWINANWPRQMTTWPAEVPRDMGTYVIPAGA